MEDTAAQEEAEVDEEEGGGEEEDVSDEEEEEEETVMEGIVLVRRMEARGRGMEVTTDSGQYTSIWYTSARRERRRRRKRNEKRRDEIRARKNVIGERERRKKGEDVRRGGNPLTFSIIMERIPVVPAPRTGFYNAEEL